MRSIPLSATLFGILIGGLAPAFAYDVDPQPLECETELSIVNDDLKIAEEELERLTGQPPLEKDHPEPHDDPSCASDLARADSELLVVHEEVHIAATDLAGALSVTAAANDTVYPICMRTCPVPGCDVCVEYLEFPDPITR